MVSVRFLTYSPINVKSYEIELSRDGINYFKIGEALAKNKIAYDYDFNLTDSIAGKRIFVRIKAVDNDGTYSYSETKQLDGTCDAKKTMLNIYPNPITDRHLELVITTTTGMFNGKYKLVFADISGRVVETKSLEINNTAQFSYKPGKLQPGIYYLTIIQPGNLSVFGKKIVKL